MREGYGELAGEAVDLVGTLNANLRNEYEELEMPTFAFRCSGSGMVILWGDIRLWVLDKDGPISECKDVIKHRVDKILRRFHELTAEQLFA